MTLKELIDSEPANAKRTDDEVLTWACEDVDKLVPLDSRKLLRWGGAGGRLARLEDAAANTELPVEVRAVARAAVLVVSREDTTLELDDPNHEALVDALVLAGVLTAADKSELIAMATKRVPRYEAAGLNRPLLGDIKAARV
ncbi:MAG: hypothetical protein K2Y51_13700 [Gammaproteobacteria bacterium]|nr:hypothetical protein [Gammaproteobacteria bacterium]